MKSNWALITLAILLPIMNIYQPSYPDKEEKPPLAQNVFIITIDGVRWQEIFSGADSALIHSAQYNPGAVITQSLYWDPSTAERRKLLMPFMWNVIGKKGQIFGNRQYENCVDAANIYALSYPGYNEMLTGAADIAISSNRKIRNRNMNILEYLASRPGFQGKVVAFTSWDVFPYILNAAQNNLPLNSGYTAAKHLWKNETMADMVEQKLVRDKKATRYDQLTYIAAREFVKQHRPRVLFLGLGETDEFAHDRRYDSYLQQLNRTDAMIGDLWHWVQTTPGYKDNTTFIITTDHGRGIKSSKWHAHGEFIKGSSQAWLAIMGPGIAGEGESKIKKQYYLEQVARTISLIVGENFQEGNAAPAIAIKRNSDDEIQY
jgi:hypothetical protein